MFVKRSTLALCEVFGKCSKKCFHKSTIRERNTIYLNESASDLKHDLQQQKSLYEKVLSNLNWNKEQFYATSFLTEFKNKGGEQLLQIYKHPYTMLSTLDPNYQWLPWKFDSRCPPNFWNDTQNQRNFMDWVAIQLNIKEQNDWYKITKEKISELGGTGLIKKYESPLSLLSSVYPEIDWLPWKFIKCPNHFWNNTNNVKKFLDWAGKQLGIQQYSDWYKVKQEDLQRIEAFRFVLSSQQPLPQVLKNVYPEFPWEEYKFTKLVSKYWGELLADSEKRENYVKYLEKELKINSEEEWKAVKSRDLRGLKTPPYWNLKEILDLVSQVKQFNVSIKSKSLSYKKTQFLLKNILQTMFPNFEMFEEYKHPDIVSPAGQLLELDYYFPHLKLAIEYQGQHHYKISSHLQRKSSLNENVQIDSLKSSLCKDKGITLIQVPYWWNREQSSLAATIFVQRPDLFTENPMGTPIRINKPNEVTEAKINREKETRKSLIAATLWESTDDPTGWWMSEKYDGVRLFWDGSSFYTRQGRKIKLPESMTLQMPNFSLDGELWTKYGLYQEAVQLCKSPEDDRWKNAVFWVFDTIRNEPYEDRIEFLNKQEFPTFIQLVNIVKCNGKEHLKEFYKSIVDKGGEGVMLREPGSLYKGGRSSSLRKYKEYFDDEVKVLENAYPHGFKCQQTNGKSLFVNIVDNQEQAKLIKEDAIITVKHSGVNVYGTLQYPRFYRERIDVKWDDLIKK